MPEQGGLQSVLQRGAAPLVLAVLAPLVAEYLLGDLRISDLAAFPSLALMYGGGAVVIREIVQRKGGSWTVFLALALAYGILGEGILDQSFFNPDFMHQHLLRYGYWPQLGTSPAWIFCVTPLHIGWSLAVPIGMTESLFPGRKSKPWLGRGGLSVAGVCFFLGALAVATFSYRVSTHHASATQLIVCILLILALLTLVYLSGSSPSGRNNEPTTGDLLALGVLCFVAGSLFIELYPVGAFILHWPGTVTAAAELAAGVCFLLFLWKRWPGPWTGAEIWSASTGGLMVYAWHGYQVDRALHGAAGLAGHTLIVAGMLTMQALAWLRLKRIRMLLR